MTRVPRPWIAILKWEILVRESVDDGVTSDSRSYCAVSKMPELNGMAGYLGLARFDGQVDYAAFRRGAWWICCSNSTGVR